jgi:hypothetical protein
MWLFRLVSQVKMLSGADVFPSGGKLLPYTGIDLKWFCKYNENDSYSSCVASMEMMDGLACKLYLLRKKKIKSIA